MIEIRDLTKIYYVNGREHRVADNINAVFPTGSAVALLGRNGAGKSTLLKMIAGSLEPTSGYVSSTGSMSWPVGLSGALHPDLTGVQNARFVARIYGVDADELTEIARDISELDDKFEMPMRSYSSGMRARLAFAMSVAIRFDTYLIDEVTSVGDQAFRDKSAAILKARLAESGAVLVSHSVPIVRQICQHGAVLENGTLYWYDDLETAIAHHLENMKRTGIEGRNRPS